MKDPASLREELARKTGARDTLLQQWRQEFGVETEADALEYLSYLETKQAKFAIRIAELEANLAKMMEARNGN